MDILQIPILAHHRTPLRCTRQPPSGTPSEGPRCQEVANNCAHRFHATRRVDMGRQLLQPVSITSFRAWVLVSMERKTGLRLRTLCRFVPLNWSGTLFLVFLWYCGLTCRRILRRADRRVRADQLRIWFAIGTRYRSPQSGNHFPPDEFVTVISKTAPPGCRSHKHGHALQLTRIWHLATDRCYRRKGHLASPGAP